MIRQGAISDANAMAEIFNHYVATSTVIFSDRILSGDDMCLKLEPVIGNFPFYVSENNGVVDGYCYAHHWLPDPVYGETWEITIYLRHDVIGRGIGSNLLKIIIDDCRRLGVHVLISFITHGNIPCERMHISAGFQLRGVLKGVGCKFGQYLDDAVYTLNL